VMADGKVVLPHPHILIEIQAVAYVPQGGR
jgi:hypothetical protein